MTAFTVIYSLPVADPDCVLTSTTTVLFPKFPSPVRQS